MDVPIFFHDLRPKKQKELLMLAGIENESQANWDIFPIATVVFGESGDDDYE